VTDSIRLTKKVQITVPIDGSGIVTLAVSALMAGVPGGLTYWNSFRVERVDFWGDDDFDNKGNESFLTIIAAQNSAWNQPQFGFSDVGTYGSRRAAVGFRLGLLDRSKYFATAATDNLCTISAPVGSFVIVQATIELLSQPISH
jgi:hypothetical protein